MLRPLVQTLLDLVYVPRCCACDAAGSRALCAACAASLYELGPACPRCAEPREHAVAAVCSRCRRRPPPFAAAHAAYRYGADLALALQRLKYHRRPDIARGLAPLFAPALARAASHADVAMPVPLHWRRLMARGFNPAASLLTHAGRGLPIAIDATSLRRIRATASQSGLSRRQRATNVAAAFAVVRGRRRRVAGKRVLLVDDVMTTGATLAACARALIEAGAREVLTFAVARAET